MNFRILQGHCIGNVYWKILSYKLFNFNIKTHDKSQGQACRLYAWNDCLCSALICTGMYIIPYAYRMSLMCIPMGYLICVYSYEIPICVWDDPLSHINTYMHWSASLHAGLAACSSITTYVACSYKEQKFQLYTPFISLFDHPTCHCDQGVAKIWLNFLRLLVK